VLLISFSNVGSAVKHRALTAPLLSDSIKYSVTSLYTTIIANIHCIEQQ